MHRVITRGANALVVAALVVLLPAYAWARTEIHFWHAMGGQLGEAVNELVKQFNQSQPDFEVKALQKGTYPEVLTSAIAAYRQKNPPHIVQVFDVGTQTMLLSGAIYPIHTLLKEQEVAITWDDFIGPVVGYYSKDGQLYSMPFNSSSPILYYNKEAFKKAGLPDRPPATWKEVEAASRKVLAAGAAKCGFTTSWPSWTMLENTFPGTIKRSRPIRTATPVLTPSCSSMASLASCTSAPSPSGRRKMSIHTAAVWGSPIPSS